MISRSLGSVSSSGPSGERNTRIFKNSGAQRVIGSLSANRDAHTATLMGNGLVLVAPPLTD